MHQVIKLNKSTTTAPKTTDDIHLTSKVINHHIQKKSKLAMHSNLRLDAICHPTNRSISLMGVHGWLANMLDGKSIGQALTSYNPTNQSVQFVTQSTGQSTRWDFVASWPMHWIVNPWAKLWPHTIQPTNQCSFHPINRPINLMGVHGWLTNVLDCKPMGQASTSEHDRVKECFFSSSEPMLVHTHQCSSCLRVHSTCQVIAHIKDPKSTSS